MRHARVDARTESFILQFSQALNFRWRKCDRIEGVRVKRECVIKRMDGGEAVESL